MIALTFLGGLMDWNPIKKLNTTVKTSFNLARPLTEKKG